MATRLSGLDPGRGPGLPAGAQNCTPDNIVLGNQADVDAFQTDHGPCDNVVSTLEVSGADIVDLGGLSGLTSIGLRFAVTGNDALPGIDLPAVSFSGRRSVGGGGIDAARAGS